MRSRNREFPAVLRARDRDRTCDLLFTRQLLYQLSYSGLDHERRARWAKRRPPGVRICKAGRMELTERERAILELERSWWTEPGPKEVAITERLELSTSRYYELLNELLDRPEAEAHDPLVVRRLRRMRDRRRRSRVESRTINEEQSR